MSDFDHSNVSPSREQYGFYWANFHGLASKPPPLRLWSEPETTEIKYQIQISIHPDNRLPRFWCRRDMKEWQ